MRVKIKLTTIFALMLALVAAAYLTLKSDDSKVFGNVDASILNNPTLFPQEITSMSKEPHQNYALYDQGNLIGYLSSETVLTDLFRQAYEERYQESFPGAQVGLGADAYLLSQTSYYYYENIDEDIVNYINDNELFAVEATKITFSNGAYCYVRDIEDFRDANEKYLLNFVSRNDYDLLRSGQLPPKLEDYGTRNVSLSVAETAMVSKGFASPNRVLQDEEDVVLYLGYGDAPSVKDYTIQKYDTVAGVAFLNGISVGNLLTINSDKIRSADQVLTEGEVINIAGFDSPINVVVKQESLERETLIPDEPKIIIDENYPMDYRQVEIEAKEGYQDTLYLTTMVNGQEYESVELETTIIERPVNAVIRVGSADIDDMGGLFIWPATGRHRISCGWMCYYNHQGIDIQPNGSGSYNYPILAAADGKVIENYYQASYGWHVRLKHAGGYTTTYAHMIRKSSVTVGQYVTRGQVIGNIGCTGNCTGAHLHFEIAVNGSRKNPCLWLHC